VPERGFDPAGLKAVVLDVDGTLYHQGPLRREMTWRLLRAHAANPLKGLRTIRVLLAYRKAQELLRSGPARSDLAEEQIRLACERTGAERAFVSSCVERWIQREPLSCVQRFARPGLRDFLQACKARDLRLGIVSDYPAEAKLAALGLAGVFDAVICTQAAEVGAFKPHARGLQVARERLGARAAEVLYVGDRAEVDAAAAAAAGMPCAIFARKPSANGRAWMEVTEFSQLHDVVCRR
jgi:HAD superfamily hydrolase (TIGR01509 family)